MSTSAREAKHFCSSPWYCLTLLGWYKTRMLRGTEDLAQPSCPPLSPPPVCSLLLFSTFSCSILDLFLVCDGTTPRSFLAPTHSLLHSLPFIFTARSALAVRCLPRSRTKHTFLISAINQSWPSFTSTRLHTTRTAQPHSISRTDRRGNIGRGVCVHHKHATSTLF